MAAALARKSRICSFLGNSPFLCKSNVSLSHYFCTSTGNIKNQTLKIRPVFDSLRTPQKSDSVLSFLRESGFSNTQLEKIVNYDPKLVSLCLEKRIKPYINIFQDSGFTPGDIAEMFANDPLIFRRSAVNKIITALSVLKGLLGSSAQVTKLLRKHVNLFGWLFSVDLEKTLLPNIEFLKSCGVSAEQINSLIYTFPKFFLLKPENMRRCVDKVDDMGVERTSGVFIYAVRTVSSMSDRTWELKLKTFHDLGFSEDDLVRVLRSAPVVLSVSGKRIKKVKEVLLETGKYDMSGIIKYPASLLYSVEKRYKPRLQVLQVLEKKGLIEKWPTLATLCCKTNEIFFEKFVVPNINEVGDAFSTETLLQLMGR